MTTTASPGPAGTASAQPEPPSAPLPWPRAVTVLPGGIRMWAPDHEPPPVPLGIWAAGAAAAVARPPGPGAALPEPAGPAPVPQHPAGLAPASPSPAAHAPTAHAPSAHTPTAWAPTAWAQTAPPETVPVTAPVPTEPADLAEARARAAALARVVVEVLAGRRAPTHLAGVATPPVLRYLTSARPGSPVRRTRPSGPGGRAGAPGCAATEPRTPRLHVGYPHPDAAEVCTTVHAGGRLRALALRLDRTGAAQPWTVTAVRLL